MRPLLPVAFQLCSAFQGLKSTAPVDEVGDSDTTNLGALDIDPRSDNTVDLPFLVLNSQTHNPRRKYHSPHDGLSDSSVRVWCCSLGLRLVLSNLCPFHSHSFPAKVATLVLPLILSR